MLQNEDVQPCEWCAAPANYRVVCRTGRRRSPYDCSMYRRFACGSMKEFGLNPMSLTRRIKSGWPIERALTAPIQRW